MLHVKNLSFGFRQRRLFHDVNLTLKPGELAHLTGPNGAGKSTLMAIVAGLIAAESGTIELFPGAGAATPVDDRRCLMEYLPAEANGLFLKMDATQNLVFWASLRGQTPDHARILAALGRFNLSHPLLKDKFPVERFSTGMKRRLALARLALSPAPLWLLDEPVYGLDTQAVGIFRALLEEHLSRGGLALVVSHETTPLTGLVHHTLTLGQEGRRA